MEKLTQPDSTADELPEDVSEETREHLDSLEQFQRDVGPVELPDFDHLQRFLLWLTAHYTSRTLTLDNFLRQRGQQGWVARRRREAATQAAYDALVFVRGTVSLALDPRAAASILDLEGETPRSAFQLLTVLPNAIRRMRDPETYFSEVRFQGLVPDWEQLVENLEEALAELKAAHRAWEDDQGHIDDGKMGWRKAMDRYRRVDSGMRHLFKGLALLADEPDLAKALVFRERAKPTRPEDEEMDGAAERVAAGEVARAREGVPPSSTEPDFQAS